MDTKTILFGIAGVVIVGYAIYKLQPGETQVVSQLIPVGTVPNSAGADTRVAFEANKTQAFLGLLGLGQAQQAATVAEKNIESQTGLELIRAKVQESAIYTDSATQLGLANIGAGLQDKLGSYDYQKVLAGFERDTILGKFEFDAATVLGKYGLDATLAGYGKDIELGGLQSKTAIELTRLQTDSERNIQSDYLTNVLEQIKLNTDAQEKRLQLQVDSLASTANQYRNQSLERQGTILNSLTTLFTGQAPYTYQGAFGGPRPPTLLQQITALAGTILPQGVGGFFGI